MKNYKINLQKLDIWRDEKTAGRSVGVNRGSKNARTSAILLTSILIAIGCNLYLAKETRDLSSATDRATQDQVREQLGPPVTVSFSKLHLWYSVCLTTPPETAEK